MPKMTGVPPKPEPVPAPAPPPENDDDDDDDEPHEKKREWWTDPIPAGEFVLGYRNDYKIYTESPTAELVEDPANLLPITPDGTKKSVGRNGTYLVYREMTQDVHAFWTYLQQSSREPGEDASARAIALGAKMVGRWPSGAPLITSPTADDSARERDNKFMYAGDKGGLVCPHGAHIRRASPRDVLAIDDRDADASVLMVRKHQMVRRGRSFGRPVDKTMDPRTIMAAPMDNERRGLHFMCLVGDINRQFEFVQRAWIHSGTFDSMYKDGDPISGGRSATGSENPNDEFTCPAAPVRRKYKAMPQFSTLVGGAYFFLPGLRALAFIARHPGPVGVP
jgi:deferrochelatase/peroxidase EfeB